MSSYIGFANLPNQVHRKSVKRGFEFTLMVVGRYTVHILFSIMYIHIHLYLMYLGES